MKRFGNLFPRVYSFESLVTAARRAFRANTKSREACEFLFQLEPNVFRLQEELAEGKYEPGPYRVFTIYEPKPRRIGAAPFHDRVVHHSVCAVLHPVFERRFILDSYACRIRKGSHAAVQRAQEFCRRNRYFLKCDVRKYFDSVDHDVLKKRLTRILKDRDLLNLLGRIIDHNLPESQAGKGIPIGNLTSQYFANFYLDALDHHVKEDLRVPGYLRYMDDCICFSDQKDDLHRYLASIRIFLQEQLCLDLKEEACSIAPVTQGLPFLGYRVFPGLMRLRRENAVRTRRKIALREKQFHEGRITERELDQSVGSLVAHLQTASTYRLRKSWWFACEG